jgi:pimeloyl-ACP methyl ester carboxylesterase
MDNVATASLDPGVPRRVALGKGAVAWVEGSGEHVLLLHGWGLHPQVFRSSLAHLASRGFEVAAPPLAVVGKNWDLDRAVHRVRKTLDALEWSDAIVVGYSLGGAVATGLAAIHPERVRLLALVNSVGLRIDRGVLGWARPLTRYARTSNLRAIQAFGYNALRARGVQNLAAAARYARAAHLDVELTGVRNHGVRAVVLWGAEDRLLPLGMGRNIADALAAPMHVIPKADHDWPIRTPALFARELDLLLRSALVAPPRRRLSGRRPRRAARPDRP